MERLLLIGFEKVGDWQASDGGALRFALERHSPLPHTLYAFAVDGEVRYVGKTTRSLVGRLRGYARPGPTQSTNVRVCRLILEELAQGSAVEIYALPDRALHHIGPFHLNLAAGLEDSIIAVVAPTWNGRSQRQVLDDESDEGAAMDLSALTEQGEAFAFVAQPTYRRSGFFNVPAKEAHLFGGDGQRIELFLGDAVEPVIGTINRTAVKSGTPRIMGGARVRDWLQAHVAEGAACRVEVLSPVSIRLIPAGPVTT